MGTPAQTSALVVKELKVLVRDRQALILLFLMPAVFILFLSFALKDVFNEKVRGTLPLVLESRDEGELAARVVERLRSRPELGIVPREGAESDRDLFDGGKAKAAVMIPEGFSRDLEALLAQGGRGELGPSRIIWHADPTLDASYRGFLKASLAMAVQGAILDHLAGLREGGDKRNPSLEDDGGRAAQSTLEPDAFLSAATEEPGARIIPTPLQQTVPGWSLFAMFFIVVPLSGSFLRERQEGTLRRLATYPVARGVIVLGKVLPYLLVNVAQFAVMLAVGVLVVPALADLSLGLGKHPWHLVPVTLAAALAATGFGILVASVSRTIEQASAFGATAVVVMAVAGGIMVPIFLMPPFMQKVALASPLYWGHQAYLDVLLREAALGAVMPKIAVLVAFAVFCFALASWKLGRRP